jgi:hypothetical protein
MPKLSGISRAVRIVRTQSNLAEILSTMSGERISQGRISTWVKRGYVPDARAVLVSKATSVPVRALVKPDPDRQIRHLLKRKRTIPNDDTTNGASDAE